MKYTTADVVFTDIPGETTLEFGITNCPYHCEGCHSPFLRENIGEQLTLGTLKRFIDDYSPAISCILIAGGDANVGEVQAFCGLIKYTWPNLKTAWYSGRETIPERLNLDYFDYIKIGPYKKDLGGLKSPTTNQHLYRIENGELKDITNQFWK